VPTKPGPSTSCAARRSEGCFAGMLLDISKDGIIGQGSVAPFSIGPIIWQGGEIDLALTPTDQHLVVQGAACDRPVVSRARRKAAHGLTPASRKPVVQGKVARCSILHTECSFLQDRASEVTGLATRRQARP